MITAIAYWFGLLWNVPLNKEGFAIASIFEFWCEIPMLVFFILSIISNKRR